MYPANAMHINASATELLSALIQSGMLSAGTARAAVQLHTQHGQPAVRVMVAGQDTEVACAQAVYQALYALFQDVWRRRGDQTAVLCLADGATTLAATDAHTARAWLQDAATQPDPTDAGQMAGLAIAGADQIHPLTTPFDAVGLLYRGKPQPGVRVIAIREDEFGAFLVFDGPESPGAPVPSPEISQHVIAPLLAEAAAHGGAGVVCDVRTQRTYAASVGALMSCVARQQIPRDEPPALNALIAHVHPLVRDAASEARAWATSGDPFRKSIGAILCLLSGFGCLFCFWLLYQMGVVPIYATVRDWAGLSLLDAPDRALRLTLFGSVVTLTVAWVFSWSFTFLELAGVMFGALTWMRRVLYGAAGADALINAVYYFRQMLPPELPTYTLGNQLLIGFGNLVGALIIGVVMAWFWEAAAVVSFVLCIALFPALVWALAALLRGSGSTLIRAYYGAGNIWDDWLTMRDDLAAHAAGQGQVVFVHGPKPTPRYGMLAGLTVGAALLVVGGIWLWLRVRGA